MILLTQRLNGLIIKSHTGHVFTYLCWNWSSYMVVKWAPGTNNRIFFNVTSNVNTYRSQTDSHMLDKKHDYSLVEPQKSLWTIPCSTATHPFLFDLCPSIGKYIPDSKVHGANMGPTWVLSAPDGSHVVPMNLAIRDLNKTKCTNMKTPVPRPFTKTYLSASAS